MSKPIYKIMFFNNDEVYEVYAKQFVESDMFGFIEIEGFLFGERTSLVIDPTEEQLALEFKGVQKTYIPAHAIIRIDQVDKKGVAKISEAKGGSNVSRLPFTADHRTDKLLVIHHVWSVNG